jgi:nitrite reductase/ring-hydroxylating ferredoxin subunit/uncharacterized membrane protein
MFQALRSFVEQQKWLDSVADPLQKALDSFYQSANPRSPGRPLQNFLNGVWIGHPLHPILTDVPVGAWTTTIVLDGAALLSDNTSLEDAADLSLATGLAAALAAAATGLTDWKDTYGAERTVGLFHGLTMLTSTLLYAQSLVSRRTGSRAAGVMLSTAAYGLVTVGAYLGGDEVFDLGYTVNHTAFQHGPSDYVPVMREEDLPAGELRQAKAKDVAIVLARVNGQVRALDDTCVHAGCSLAGGKLEGFTVECPCHFSRYDMRDGSVINGPATMPEPHYDVRINAGMIEVRQA